MKGRRARGALFPSGRWLTEQKRTRQLLAGRTHPFGEGRQGVETRVSPGNFVAGGESDPDNVVQSHVKAKGRKRA
jgi:hypothetical protein